MELDTGMRVMTKRFGVMLILLGCVVAVAVAEGDGFTSLFDGKTLSGWVADHTDRFLVRGGVLVQDGGTGWLKSAKPFKDFELVAEYRSLKPGADSGIFFRASTNSTAQPPHWPEKGYQLQIVDNPDSHLKIFGHGTPPPTYDRKTNELAKALKPRGEWQTISLKVVGRRAEVALNGVRVTVSESIVLPEGCVGIQGENGQFEWRSLKIKPL